MKTVQPPPPAQTLTVYEQRLLSAYRRMDAESKLDLQAIADCYAREYPHRHAPVLRLLIGGAK
ncbi:hypothetical protein [Rugamonas apoptosis]|uniref:Uncharacterized protein n=1 Tax=Rugamonas apoptosis TaxID=2758570 RepID=A0A7W2F8C7_9BURK|nr:hypothetical protein [Rugamonas apoptosis]MBA5686960.1 hypothetical protein [Rugamonas apoptosis]